MYFAKGIVLTVFLIVFKVSNDDIIDAHVVARFGGNNMRFPYVFHLRTKLPSRHIIRRPLRYMPGYRVIKTTRMPQATIVKKPIQKQGPSLDEMISALDKIEKHLNRSSVNKPYLKSKAIPHLNQQGINNISQRKVQFTPTKSQKTSTTVIPSLTDNLSTKSEKYTTTESNKSKTSDIDKKILLLLAMSLATDLPTTSSKLNTDSDNPGYEIPSSDRNNAESIKDSIALPFKRQEKTVDGRPESKSTQIYVNAGENDYRKPYLSAVPSGRYTESVSTSSSITEKHINKPIRQSLKDVGIDTPPYSISSIQHSPNVPEYTKTYSQKGNFKTGAIANTNTEQRPQLVVYQRQSTEIERVQRPTGDVNEFRSQRKFQQKDVIQPQSKNFLTLADVQSSKPLYNSEVSQLKNEAPFQNQRINNQEMQQIDRTVLFDQMKYDGKSIKPQLFETIPTSVQALDKINHQRKHQNPSQKDFSKNIQPDLSGPKYKPFLQKGRANPYGITNKGVTSQHSNGFIKEVSKRGEASLQHKELPQHQTVSSYVTNKALASEQYQNYKPPEQLSPIYVTNKAPLNEHQQYAPNERLSPIDVMNEASSKFARTTASFVQQEHSRSSDSTNTRVTSGKNKQFIPQQIMGPSNVLSDTGAASVTGQFQQYIPQKLPGPRDVTDNVKSNTVVTSGQFNHHIPRESVEPSSFTNKIVENNGVTSGQYHKYIPTGQLRPSDVSSTSQKYIPRGQLGPRDVTHNVASKTAVASGGEFNHYTPKNLIDHNRVTNTMTRQTGMLRDQHQAGTTGGQRVPSDVTNTPINNGASMSNTETGVIKGKFKLNNQVLSCVCQPQSNDISNMYKQEQNHG